MTSSLESLDPTTLNHPATPSAAYLVGHRARGTAQPDTAPYLEVVNTNPNHAVLYIRNNNRHSFYSFWEQCSRNITIIFRHMINFLYLQQTLWATKAYHGRFRYNIPADENAAEQGGSSPSGETSQWENTLNRISCGWKMILSGSTTVLVPSAVGMLQLQTISNNCISRAFVISAFLLACASSVCSLLYIGHKRSFVTPLMVVQWKEAADHNCEFWRLIALPFSFMLWASVFLVGAVLVLAWGGVGGSSSGNTVSPGTVSLAVPLNGIFITAIFAVCIVKVYLAINRLRDM